MDKQALLKHLNTNYKCVVNPCKKKYYDFRKKKYRHKRDLLHGNWPSFGFICPICDLASSFSKHFLIGGVAMCEECALEKLKRETT